MKKNILNKEVVLNSDLECGESIDFGGKINGDIKAKKVILRKTAIVKGNIWYKILRVEEGAIIIGNLTNYNDKKLVDN